MNRFIINIILQRIIEAGIYSKNSTSTIKKIGAYLYKALKPVRGVWNVFSMENGPFRSDLLERSLITNLND